MSLTHPRIHATHIIYSTPVLSVIQMFPGYFSKEQENLLFRMLLFLQNNYKNIVGNQAN